MSKSSADELDRGIPPERAFGVNIDERNVNMRISQPNSFGLLILAFIMFLWLLFRCVIRARFVFDHVPNCLTSIGQHVMQFVKCTFYEEEKELMEVVTN